MLLRFCKTSILSLAQAVGTFKKNGIKPSEQVAAPDGTPIFSSHINPCYLWAEVTADVVPPGPLGDLRVGGVPGHPRPGLPVRGSAGVALGRGVGAVNVWEGAVRI